jgi:hypothetical protein
MGGWLKKSIYASPPASGARVKYNIIPNIEYFFCLVKGEIVRTPIFRILGFTGLGNGGHFRAKWANFGVNGQNS